MDWRRARRALSALAAGIVILAVGVVAGPRPAAAAGPSFTNPVVGTPNSGDPTLVYYNGFYYYVATTWSSNVVMRRSSTIAGLKSAPEQVVVQTGGTTMWAPHLEMVGSRWYLYYSVEGFNAARRTHVAESAGTDPLGPYTVRGILNLMPNNGWAIDAALVKLNNALYMTFSAFSPVDNLQSLYLAPMSNAWTAGAFGSRISAPTLSWEKQDGAVNEGGFVLQRNGRTFMTYSASHCNGPNYKLGMLEYKGGDPRAGVVDQVRQPDLPAQRRERGVRAGPPLVLHLARRHRDLDRLPRQLLGRPGLRHHPHHAGAEDLLERRRHPEPRRPRVHLDRPRGAVGETGTLPAAKKIRNRHSGLCLDDYNYVVTPGAEVRQWTCNGLPVQDWLISDAGGGYAQIANRHSGLCLDDKDFATAAGAVVQQWTCNGLAVQQWKVTDVGGGYSTLTNRHSGLCLDNYNFGTAPGAEVRQWTCNGNNAQQWTIA